MSASRSNEYSWSKTTTGRARPLHISGGARPHADDAVQIVTPGFLAICIDQQVKIARVARDEDVCLEAFDDKDPAQVARQVPVLALGERALHRLAIGQAAARRSADRLGELLFDFSIARLGNRGSSCPRAYTNTGAGTAGCAAGATGPATSGSLPLAEEPRRPNARPSGRDSTQPPVALQDRTRPRGRLPGDA